MTQLSSSRSIYGDRRGTSVRDVRSYEQAQETATSDVGHGAKRHLDGCIDAAQRSERRGPIDPIELVINAPVDPEYRSGQSSRAGDGQRQPAYLRKGAR
jgi:hypothetical protein